MLLRRALPLTGGCHSVADGWEAVDLHPLVPESGEDESLDSSCRDKDCLTVEWKGRRTLTLTRPELPTSVCSPEAEEVVEGSEALSVVEMCSKEFTRTLGSP